MALGPRDLSLLTLPVGWDATELKKIENRANVNYDTVAQMLNAALGALNSEIASDPLWSKLVSYTTKPEWQYRVGVSNGFEEHTEYGRPDAKRADTTGHMLPLRKFDRRLGWTYDYLEEADMDQIEADIADAVKDARDRVRVDILTRLLQRGDDTGARYGLGSGYSPGFATTAASTNVDYTPPSFGGTTFASTHEHYIGSTGGAFVAGDFTDASDELAEHGHTPPFDFLIGPSDEAAVIALTDFVGADNPLIRYGAMQDVAAQAMFWGENGVKFIGVHGDCNIWVVRGMPQYYGVAFKSYGANSQRNPLKIRVDMGSSIQFEAITDPTAGSPLHPLQNLMLRVKYGVGVGDRTAGTPRYNNNATWADGTPT